LHHAQTRVGKRRAALTIFFMIGALDSGAALSFICRMQELPSVLPGQRRDYLVDRVSGLTGWRNADEPGDLATDFHDQVNIPGIERVS
jgi:hypothetical protein